MRSDVRLGRGWRQESQRPDLFGEASEDEARGVLPGPWQEGRAEQVARLIPLAQGSYYLVSGIWPLVHMKSFEWVTGRKTDRWLVRSVGALAAAIGVGLLQAGRNGHVPRELRTVAQLAAAGLIAVETPTALRGRVPPIYLADAVVEAGFIAANAWAARQSIDSAAELDARIRREAEELY